MLSHTDAQGQARMVDVTAKAVSERVAVAVGRIAMKPETLRLVLENGMKKGDVLACARIAGIMAAKKCAELIPLCHPVPLTHVGVMFMPDTEKSEIRIEAQATALGQTGVEMEALTAVSVAALTLYDMCKAADKSMHIEGIFLKSKSGGKSGDYHFTNH